MIASIDIENPGALVSFMGRLARGEKLNFADGEVRFSIERTGSSFLIRDAQGEPIDVFATFVEAWRSRPRAPAEVAR